MSKISPSKDNEEYIEARMMQYYKDEIVSKRHNCTDVLCLIIFVIFSLGQIALSVIIYFNGGDPRNFLLPHDSNGNVCIDKKPYLFYFNIIECISVNTLVSGCSTPSICVSQCPSSNLYYIINSNRQFMYDNYCKPSELSTFFNGNKPPSIDQQTYLNLVKKNICPIYTLQSSSIYGRCLPSFLGDVYNETQAVLATDSTTNSTFQINDLSQDLNFGLVSKAIKSIVNLMNIKTFAQFALEDFVNSAVLIVVLFLICAVVSFIYIIVLRWILAPLIYLTLITMVACLSFCIYFCFTKYQSLNKNPNQEFQLKADFNYYLSLSTTWLVIGIVSAVILFIVLLLIIVLLKRLRLAIQLIGEASKAVVSVFMSLLFPIIPLLLQIGFLAYFVSNAVILAMAGKALFRVANVSNSSNLSVNVGDSCDPNQMNGALCVFHRVGFDASSAYGSVIGFLNTYQWAPQLYNLFMFFWLQTFIVGFNQMVLAGCFGIWYWSRSRSSCILVTSLKDTLIYHLGSIAFGSLLIAICKFLRTLIQLVERRVKSAAGHNQQLNCIVSFLSCCCRCCLWCLENVLKFISRNAYIMVIMFGKNFCRSARDAVALLASNPLRALVLDRVTDFVLFLGRLFITAGVSVLGFYFFSKSFYVDPQFKKYFAPDLHFYWLPLIVVILGSYKITKTFFTVFEMAVDTIFLCAMKDLDINDGSEQKPYMMSKKLLKILNVHNMIPKNDDEQKF